MAGDGCVRKTRSTLKMRYFTILLTSFCGIANGESASACTNCRWNVVREAEDNTKVIVEDNSEHKINWKWEVSGGHWNVTYSFKYPEEYYTGRAVFVNSSMPHAKENAFVSWGSSVPWTSNAVPIYSASPWNISYNCDIFGFIPTDGGRYIFRIFTRNKKHDPFAASEHLTQHPAPCSLTATDPAVLGKWWQEQKVAKVCPELSFARTWPGKSGNWTVSYRYVDNIRQTSCDVFYVTPSVHHFKLINWKVDELRQTVSYAANPVRMYEDRWQISLTPAEIWGFTPKGNGQWVFQHFSYNLVFQPFNDFRGPVLYAVQPGVPAGVPVQPAFFQTVNSPSNVHQVVVG